MPEQRSRVEVAEAPPAPPPGPVGAPTAPPLLASRLSPPALPEPLLLRPRLLDRLDQGAAGPLTLVRAPAGWGKTTLLSCWARHTATAPAWVGVEDGDTGTRLWSYLAAALRSAAGGGSDDGPPPVPDTPPRPEELERLAAALAARERPVLLVLDDLHRVTDPAALAGLEFLLRHTGQRLRLVVGARTGLPPALHRWRLAGELTEVGPDELACTDDEVADLLVAHGVSLPAAAVPRLRDRTGGWPAGLRLAALALRAQPAAANAVERFGGDHPDVAGYLREEVLGPLDPDARDLLLRTAVADSVCADLAGVLSGRGDAGQRLADLARGGAFLRHDDSDPPWYRCQPLLADLLRAELGRLPADEVRDLHRRAAGWYAGNGRPADALRHALAAGEWDRATELFLAGWPELAPYERDVPSAPPPAEPPVEAVRRDPELALACAAERAYAGDVDAAAGHLRAAVGYARELPVPRRDRFRRLADALELALARLAGDHGRVRRAAARLLATRTAPGPRDDPRAGSGEDADARAVAGTALGLVELAQGELRVAGDRFAGALLAARQSGRARTELVCASRAAVLDAVRGRLRVAERTAREALAMPACQGWSCRVDCGHAYLALALVALHRDEEAEAAAQLALAGPAAAEPGVAPLAALCAAELLAGRGEEAAALHALTAARSAIAGEPSAGGGEPAAWLTAAEAQLRAAVGDLDTARTRLADALRDAEPEGPAAAALRVAAARIELRAGDPRAAGQALPDWSGPTAESWPLPVRLAAGLLDAVLARVTGDGRRAGRIMEQVLDLAAPEGYRRVFTRGEPGVRDLLAAHLDSGTAHWATVSDLVRGVDEHDADEVPPARPDRALDEPLTERELTILRYLQSILSNVEIAGELSLSVNTVKTHVRNIYRKLDATRRREAVRRARELRLI